MSAPTPPYGTRLPRFELLVTRSASMVRRIAMRVLHNSADADDVAQETYARLHRLLPTIRERRAVYAFIARIARHVALDRLRDRRRHALLDDDTDDAVAAAADDAPSSEQLVAAQQQQADVRRAFDELPGGQRAVLALHVAGRSSTSIAAELGIPVGTVESRLHRARRALAEQLGGG